MRLQNYGIPPSFDEMKDALNLKSKSGIHRLITSLQERGYIRRIPHRARALEILKLPESKSDTDDLNIQDSLNCYNIKKNKSHQLLQSLMIVQL